MKTLKDFVEEHVAKKAALISDPEALMRDAMEAKRRIDLRLKEDPSLASFTRYYAEAIVSVLPALPPAAQRIMFIDMLPIIIAEWEDINIQYENQLKAAPLPPVS